MSFQLGRNDWAQELSRCAQEAIIASGEEALKLLPPAAHGTLQALAEGYTNLTERGDTFLRGQLHALSRLCGPDTPSTIMRALTTYLDVIEVRPTEETLLRETCLLLCTFRPSSAKSKALDLTWLAQLETLAISIYESGKRSDGSGARWTKASRIMRDHNRAEALKMIVEHQESLIKFGQP